MPELNSAGFSEFFRDLWGYDPFPWQAALAHRVLTNGASPWPDAIAVPTAAGKTACLDIAIFTLAARYGTDIPAPRRIWFVVDRRVIVDESYNRARILARKLQETTGGITLEVAERLRALAGGSQPLAAHLLRGGVYRDDAWARSPLQPAVIASTVDQFGSRLFFRAYGRSFKAWSIQAGLAGNDSLVLLDEAHCARPFLDSLRAVCRYRTLAVEPLPSPFQAVILSATPPEETGDRHELGGADLEHPLLGRRLRAEKPALLGEPIVGKGKDTAGKFAQSLAEAALGLIDPVAGRLAVVIFVNRVATARRVHDMLERKGREHDLVLLTGRMRPLDKDDTVATWLHRLDACNAESRQLARPVIVVATQTLEVGANLDFDALVSECASLDALRQRMGRLNRAGRPMVARAVLLIRDDQAEKSDDDPVYGTSLADTWKWLQRVANDAREVDFGVNALLDLLPDSQELHALNSPVRHAPVLLPAHLDALVQTAPVPQPSPDPALFLHGPDRGAADVQVCWRADLDPSRTDTWADTVALCPPAASELLTVPFGRFRSWLAGEKHGDDNGDIEGSPVAFSDNKRGAIDAGRVALRWFGREEAEVITGPDRLRPGDVVVLPTNGNGLSELGHHPPHVPFDHGDRAFLETRGKVVLRLHPGPMAEWPAAPAKERLLLMADEMTRREEEPDEWLNDLRTVLREVSGQEIPGKRWEWLSVAAGNLAEDPALGRLIIDHPCGGLVLRGSRQLRPDNDGGFTDEDDPSASGTVRIELYDHLQRVGERARRHGILAPLPQTLIEALGGAGERHDIGKADPRFQSWLHGGRTALGPLLAKSTGLPQSPPAVRRARERAGYPAGGRHELLTVRLLEAAGLDPAVEPDLILHLVASHHGHCRPFAPVVIDPNPVMVRHPSKPEVEAGSATSLERLDSGVAERFWRLTRRFGWWGLAWLEALLRLADHLESAEEQK